MSKNREFEARADELKGQGIEGEGNGEVTEKFLKSLESLKIMVPEPVDIDVPGSGQKIKVVELAVKKHLEVEKMMNELHIQTTEKFKDYKNLTFDQLFNLRLEDWKTIRPLIMAICDNGINPFVTEEFCDNYISQSLAMNIVYTYIMKFFIPVFIQRMQMQSFFGSVLVLSGTSNPKTGLDNVS